jgi:hypothetical protein
MTQLGVFCNEAAKFTNFENDRCVTISLDCPGTEVESRARNDFFAPARGRAESRCDSAPVWRSCHQISEPDHLRRCCFSWESEVV